MKLLDPAAMTAQLPAIAGDGGGVGGGGGAGAALMPHVANKVPMDL